MTDFAHKTNVKWTSRKTQFGRNTFSLVKIDDFGRRIRRWLYSLGGEEIFQVPDRLRRVGTATIIFN